MATTRSAPAQEVRIIAGIWRGRRLRFPQVAAIRPTPDRVRETLFNWLAPYIRGTHVLDLFAGSGALGFEACSRGAAAATLLDTDPRCITALQQHAERLQAAQVTVIRADALAWLARPRAASVPPFDIVFVDPPFAAGLWQNVVSLLESGGWLAPGAFIYVESPLSEPLPQWPDGWQFWRTGKAGEVGYHLLRRAE
ncbi:MAG: 16S rRNA (guanine(966)-N(2))-methyltransferase RsmD [Sinobacteraceae bacterium]|nr:16S rRNA (guanine(966)-N(2))-methyltransferase RsmD [Nevskiaceae bacterium]